MPSDARSADRHKHPPLRYRPPADVRPALEARMQETGLGASAILSEALRAYLSIPASPAEPAA